MTTGARAEETAIKPQTSAASPAVTTRVTSIRFVGAASMPVANLTTVTAPWIGRNLTFAQLQEIPNAVTAYYRRQGFMVARAYMGAQTVRDGVLVVNVAEGKWSEVKVRANRTLVSDQQILRTLAVNLCRNHGDCKGVGPIKTKRVERASLLVSEIPGVKATYELEAGKELASTSLFMTAEPTKRFNVTAGGDNTGFKYTGRNRGSLGVSASNLIGIGDLVSLNGTYSGKGFYSFAFDASLPVGYSGARFGFDASHLQYTLGGEFAVLNATGVSDTVGLYATYPLMRNLSGAADLRLDIQGKDNRSKIAALNLSRKNESRAAVATVNLSGTQLDSLFTSASTQYRLAYTRGELQIRQPQDLADDKLTDRTDGPYGKVYGMLRREEVVVPGLTLYGQVSGQYALTNLDSSEKFTLAGSSAVRSYSSGAAAADNAALLTVESRIRVPSSLTGKWQVIVAPFYDHAWAQFNKRTWLGYTGGNEAQMAGAGIYVSLAYPGRYSLRVSYAQHVKTQQDFVTGGGNQLWVEAAAAF